jgi:hypothetical protein
MNPESSQQLPLRDVHLPAEPGFWPLAPGWWLLAALLLVILVGFTIWLYRYRQRQKKWYYMRQLLLSIQQDYQSHGNEGQFTRDLSNLLRRFTRHQLNNPEAATLSGDPWIAFLNRDLSEPLFDGLTETLNTNLYQQHAHYKTNDLFQAVHQFIRLHCLYPKRRQS